MPYDVRRIDADEFQAIVTMDGRAFGLTYTDDLVEDVRGILELDRTLVALDGTEVVGSTSAFTMEMTVPGGAAVPTAGVTWVGVMPTHRRRGILRQLMTEQLDDLLDRGEPLAALSASESGIYGRFGYGMATQRARLFVATKRVRLRDGLGDDGLVRFADGTVPRTAFPAIYERLRAVVPGTMSRDDRWWDHQLRDPEVLRDGATPLFHLLHPDGYASFRRRWDFGGSLPTGQAIVAEFVAVTPAAHAALWRVLLGLDLVDSITFTRYSPDDPLPWLVDDLRQIQTTGLWDDTWVRLLHVPRALEGRRYLADDRFVLELVDPCCPAIGGTFELEGGADGATCKRSTAEPDLVMDIREMGSLYLGGVRATVLVRAGRIEERTVGAARRADAFFASDPPPHNQTGF